jgi:hypothetical protein
MEFFIHARVPMGVEALPGVVPLVGVVARHGHHSTTTRLGPSLCGRARPEAPRCLVVQHRPSLRCPQWRALDD